MFIQYRNHIESTCFSLENPTKAATIEFRSPSSSPKQLRWARWGRWGQEFQLKPRTGLSNLVRWRVKKPGADKMGMMTSSIHQEIGDIERKTIDFDMLNHNNYWICVYIYILYVMLCYVMLYYIILYYNILYYTILYYIILYYTIFIYISIYLSIYLSVCLSIYLFIYLPTYLSIYYIYLEL